MEMIKHLAIKALCFPAMALCSLFVFAEPSKGADVPITYLFTGSVTSVSGALFNPPGTSLTIGSMSGSITFNSAADELFPNTGVYLDSVSGLTLTIPKTVTGVPTTYSPTWVSGGNNAILIGNSNPGGGTDQFTATTSMTG